jgi:RND superfamily putative drug exporter
MRRPGLYAGLVAALMLLLAIPGLSLSFRDGALAQFPPGDESRLGAELAAREGPAGASAPTVVVADFERGDARSARNRAVLERYAAGLRATGGIAAVGRPRISRDGGAAMLRVVSSDDPESDATRELIRRMRAEGGAASGLDRLARISVGGPTADNIDFVALVSGGIWKVFLFVIACSYLILLVVLRSVLLPLKAVLMNALTVGAAYGVLVAVFQYGWLDGPTGYESLGYINSVTPPLLLAIVFGLSMDYEVFLLSRIRERWLATGDNRRAVAEGLEASAGVITSAALIMVAVFATFALTGVPQVKEIGVGLAVAIALDATLVRLVLVPAAMGLMGDWNWWLPGWLERILPRVDVEGTERPAPAPA